MKCNGGYIRLPNVELVVDLDGGAVPGSRNRPRIETATTGAGSNGYSSTICRYSEPRTVIARILVGRTRLAVEARPRRSWRRRVPVGAVRDTRSPSFHTALRGV